MGLFRKKPAQISEHARRLNAEIAALEAQIKQLSSNSTVPGLEGHPHPANSPPDAPRPAPAAGGEPIFEKFDQQKLRREAATNATLGNRREVNAGRFDALVFWRRLQEFFRGPPPANPKLVNYLAAGGIHGLRPLRYEKRVARYRLIFLCGLLMVALWIIVALVRRL